MLDFVLLTDQTLSYVQNFAFYSIFNGYIEFITISNVKAILLVIVIILSLIFFGLEIRGAVYMK